MVPRRVVMGLLEGQIMLSRGYVFRLQGKVTQQKLLKPTYVYWIIQRCAGQFLCHQLGVAHRHDGALISHTACVRPGQSLLFFMLQPDPVRSDVVFSYNQCRNSKWGPTLEGRQHRAAQPLLLPPPLPRDQDHLQYSHTNSAFIIHLRAVWPIWQTYEMNAAYRKLGICSLMVGKNNRKMASKAVQRCFFLIKHAMNEPEWGSEPADNVRRQNSCK